MSCVRVRLWLRLSFSWLMLLFLSSDVTSRMFHLVSESRFGIHIMCANRMTGIPDTIRNICLFVWTYIIMKNKRSRMRPEMFGNWEKRTSQFQLHRSDGVHRIFKSLEYIPWIEIDRVYSGRRMKLWPNTCGDKWFSFPAPITFCWTGIFPTHLFLKWFETTCNARIKFWFQTVIIRM